MSFSHPNIEKNNEHRIKVIRCSGIIRSKKILWFAGSAGDVVQPCHSFYLSILSCTAYLASGGSLVNISSLYNNLNMSLCLRSAAFLGTGCCRCASTIFALLSAPLFRSFIQEIMCWYVYACRNMQIFYNDWVWCSNNYLCTSLSLPLSLCMCLCVSLPHALQLHSNSIFFG